jgi:DNA-binding beta-propeller fold protein YncE
VTTPNLARFDGLMIWPKGASLLQVMALASLLILSLTACLGGSTGLARPNGVVIAPDGTIYVMDRGHYRVVHLSANGDFLGAFGRLGSGPGDIYAGWDIALDSAGNIYICNLVFSEEGSFLIHDGVKVFSPDGRFLRELGGQDYPTDQTVLHHRPYGLDIDSQDRVYVADFDANTVRVFDPQGQLLATFFGQSGSEDGQFNGLTDVAVDDQRSLMYVTDQYNSRVQLFKLDTNAAGELTATHRQTIGSYGRRPGQFAYPQNITVDDRNERLYVGDMANRRIQVFGAEGQPISEIKATEDWQVLGLDVGPDHAVYAADALNNAIWVFEPDGRLRRQIEVAR